MPAGRKLEDWSYTNNPEGRRVDKIRLLVGDVDDDLQLIEDAAIEYRMLQNSDDNTVAALVAQDISARFLKYASKSAKDYSENLGGVSKAYAERAAELWKASPSAIPVAPQLRFSTRRPMQTDTDLKQPQFSVGMLSEDATAIDPQGTNEFGKSTGVE